MMPNLCAQGMGPGCSPGSSPLRSGYRRPGAVLKVVLLSGSRWDPRGSFKAAQGLGVPPPEILMHRSGAGPGHCYLFELLV